LALGDEICQEESISLEIFGIGNLWPLAVAWGPSFELFETGIDEGETSLYVVMADRDVV
jgi:hypothetical protein